MGNGEMVQAWLNRFSLRQPAGLVLAGVLLLVALKQLAWLVVLPLWQTPDEPAHFHYVQYLAEVHRLPLYTHATPVNTSSEEAAFTERNSTLVPVAFHPENRATFTRSAFGPGEERLDRGPAMSRINDGNSTAAVYAPAYYFPASLLYRALERSNVLARIFAIRAFSILFVLVTVAAAFFLAGEVWKSLVIRAAFALFVGFQPMFSMLGVSVNNDAMLIALASLALLLLARQWRQDVAPIGGLAMGALVGLGMLAKPQMLAFIGIVPAILAYRILLRRASVRQALTYLLGFGAAVALLFSPWVLYCKHTYGTFLPPLPGEVHPQAVWLGEYLWKFVLQPGTSRLHTLWVVSHWACFGWLDTVLPDRVYVALGAMQLLGAVGVVRWVVGNGEGKALAAGSFLVATAYAAFLYLVEYQLYRATGSPVLQGRYWLPVVLATSMVTFGGGLTLVNERQRVRLAVLMAIAVIALNAASILRLLERYYA